MKKYQIENVGGYTRLENLPYKVLKNGSIKFSKWGYDFEIKPIHDDDIGSDLQFYNLFRDGEKIEHYDDDVGPTHLFYITVYGEQEKHEQLVRGAWSWISNHF